MINAKKFTPDEVKTLIEGDALSSYDLNGQIYYMIKKSCLANTVRIDDIQATIIEKLLAGGWQVFQSSKGFCPKDATVITKLAKKNRTISVLGKLCSMVRSERLILVYEKDGIDIYASFNAHSTGDKLYSILLNYPCDSTKEEEDKIISFIEETFSPYVRAEVESKFYILIKDEYGELSLRSFETKVPAKIDLEKSYGKGFEKINKAIIDKLNAKLSGLYIFHGAPGTGKSTYIKYMACACPEKKFVYIPEFMMSMLNQPDVIRLLISHENVILVVEDAEKIIQKREGSDNSNMVSTLLNFTDGILSDILKLSIILTYNTNTEDIDPALLRKGRLQYKYEFQLLTKAQSMELMKHSGVSEERLAELDKQGLIKDHMALADIFNISEENGNAKTKKETKIGF